MAGVIVSFDQNTEAYRDFGSRNKSSLGELLFHFFRYYGHELDFEQNVVSVRLGRCLSKVEKSWHLLQDNRLCVEEPFNLSRNLANTADDTSMRGIHSELRRAFDLIGDGKIQKCCEQFVHSPDEIKLSDLFVPPSSRPVIPQFPIQPSRGGRNAARGGRNASTLGRNSNGRRSSNPSGRNTSYLRNPPFQMTTHELQLQQQHQQHLLHDQLFQQYRYLQLQEQELRMQLAQQNLQQRGAMAAYGQQAGYSQYASQDDAADSAMHGQVNGISRAPMSAPLYQHGFSRSPYLSASRSGVSTNPPSPRLTSMLPDMRRYSRPTSIMQQSVGGSLRAQSQPARAAPFTATGLLHRPDIAGLQESSLGRRSSVSSNSQNAYGGNSESALYDQVRRPAEYLGYYVGQSPSLCAYTHSTAISPIPSHIGLAIRDGGLSPRLAPASPRPSVLQTPPQQTVTPVTAEGRSEHDSASKGSESTNNDAEPAKHRSGPLIVDGSINSPRRKRMTQSTIDPEDNVNISASTSEDMAMDTPSSSDEQSQDPCECNAQESSSPISPSGARRQIRNNGVPASINGHLPLKPLGSSPKAESQTGLTSLAAIKRAAGTAWPLDRQLSSVEEVRTPSPRVETFNLESLGRLEGQDPTLGGVTARTTGEEHGRDRPLAERTNGGMGASAPLSALNPSGGSAWQTQKKKKQKRKTVKSENDAKTVNLSGGEALPADESLRKGG